MADHYPTDIKEIWKMISDFPDYEVSNLGRVRRCVAVRGAQCGRILKPQKNKSGYMIYRLYKSTHLGESQDIGAHIVVAKAFLGPRPPGLQINHKNGVKADNRVENLEYVTSSENVKHAYAIGLRESGRGEEHCNARLTNEQVCAIRDELKDYRWGDYSRLGRKYGVSREHIRSIHLGSNRIYG